jgi:uncharacterized protein
MTDAASTLSCTAFRGHRRLAAGPLTEVALAVRREMDGDRNATVLVFDDASGHAIDLDLRGDKAEIVGRLAQHPFVKAREKEQDDGPRRPGRPRLGVVAREVTLLPRHWEWLNAQPGGASVTLRKLIDEARQGSGTRDRVRRASEVAYRFLSAMSGNEPGYEEAVRALFARDRDRFTALIAAWPRDVADYAARLAAPAFPG